LRVVPPVVRDVGKTTRVAQQTPGRDLRCPTVGQREFRHPLDDRGIQVEHRLAAVARGRQRHDRGGDERLGHRRQVEHRLRCDRRAAADVTDAEPTRDDHILAYHRNGHARHLVRAEERLDQRPQTPLHGFPKVPRTHVHLATLRRQRVAASRALPVNTRQVAGRYTPAT